jgi:hypothetical protein
MPDTIRLQDGSGRDEQEITEETEWDYDPSWPKWSISLFAPASLKFQQR